MGVRKVYGSLESPATLKVLACLFEHHLDFEFVAVDLAAGEQKQKPFLSLNPFGQVPVYSDGEIVQFESRAIIRCMSHEYAQKIAGAELIDWDSRKQGVVANWVDVEDHLFEPPALKLLNPQKGGVAVSEAEAKLAEVLDVYEARLGKFKYLVSDKYTIVDLLHLPNLQSLMGTPAKKLIESRPLVRSWCADILARPAWAKVLEMKKTAQAKPGKFCSLEASDKTQSTSASLSTMAARKLYGVAGATSTMRALASLFEHNIDFEFVAVNVAAGEHLREPLVTLTPFGLLPVYQDGDAILFESRAIMRTISHTYPHPEKDQIYMTPKMQGIAATWIDVEDHQFDPPASRLISELWLKPNRREPADKAAVAEAEADLARVLDVYEERLGSSEFLGGDKFTSADVTHLPSLYYLMKTPVMRLFEERRLVSEWCAGIMARPAWAKVAKMVEAADSL